MLTLGHDRLHNLLNQLNLRFDFGGGAWLLIWRNLTAFDYG
jgi:hypothetical protein